MRALRWTVAAALVALAGAAWAQQDRGEQPTEEEVLTLGPDVERTVGKPALAPPSPEEAHHRTERLAADMRCPVCQGLPIADSPSESARNMKGQVRAMVAAGFSDQQVMDYFVTSYGEFVLLSPPAEGLNVVLWVAPLLMLVAGALVVGYILRRRAPAEPATGARAAATPAAGPDEASDPWIARVRREVAQHDD